MGLLPHRPPAHPLRTRHRSTVGQPKKTVNVAGDGQLRFTVKSASSVPIFAAIDQQIGIDLSTGKTTITIEGDPYPSIEAVRFLPGQTQGEILASSSQAPVLGPGLWLRPTSYRRIETWENGVVWYQDEDGRTWTSP